MLSFAAAVLSAAPQPRELQSVPTWCNVYTCALATCANFPGCPVAETACEWWCNSWTSGMAHCSACTGSPEPLTYTHVTDVSYTPGTGVQPYMKIRSATCGYADLMGAVFNDPTIFTELGATNFYGFYSGTSGLGYVSDAAMTSPDACNAYCAANAGCEMFYYQYEWTLTSRMTSAGAAGRWMHKCQLLAPFTAAQGAPNCGSPFAGDTNDWDEYAGRASAAGSK
jgi:hypothetical protein